MNLGQAPKSMQLSPVSSQKLLLTMGTEVLLITAGKAGKPLVPVNLYSTPDGDRVPVSCYLPDGTIVIAYEGGGEVFTPRNLSEAAMNLKFPTDLGIPINICASGLGGFAILTSRGQLIVFSK